MAEAYHRTPSELLKIQNPLHAYFLDRAVFYFGVAIDADMERSTRDAKNEKMRVVKQNMVFNRWKITEGSRGYRDPNVK